MVGLDVLEVAVRTHLQFISSGIVADNDTLLVHLQGADSPHLHYRAFYGMIQGACLVVAIYNDHHFLGAEYSAYTYGQSRLGHLVHIVVEEA